MLMNSDQYLDIKVGNQHIRTQECMKVLGISFDSKLSWDSQVSNTISKTNRTLHGLKLVRRHFNRQQMTQIVTSFYFSTLYYGIEVWYHRGLSFHLKQKIRSAHYRAMRLIYGDLGRDQLDVVGQRATPDELSNYALGKFLAKMMITTTPSRLFQLTLENSYTVERQPGRLFFYDTSRLKIGRQIIKNRVSCISKQMKFKWLDSNLSALRPCLKKCFFNYYVWHSFLFFSLYFQYNYVMDSYYHVFVMLMFRSLFLPNIHPVCCKGCLNSYKVMYCPICVRKS